VRHQLVAAQRPFVVASDVYQLVGDRSHDDVRQALKVLRQAGVVRYAEGSKRRMELAPQAPQTFMDGRGRAPGSLNALKRNSRASMATPRPVGGRNFVRDW
jgi:hypothetical protein